MKDRVSLFQKLAMPKLKNREVENFLGVATGTGVISQQLFDRSFLEITAADGFGIQENIMDPVLEFVTQPLLVRNRKTGFFAVENFARNPATQGLLGDVLGGETAHLEICGQRSGKLNHLMIEQGYTELNGISHGHLVGFNQQVVRQPSFGIDVEHLGERACAVAAAEVFCGGV